MAAHGRDRELWLSLKAEAAERHEKHLNNRYLGSFHRYDADWGKL